MSDCCSRTATTVGCASAHWAPLAALLLVFVTGCFEAVELVAAGDAHDVRERPNSAASRSPARPSLLLLLFDGIGRELLYEELQRGKLPGLAKLLAAEAADSNAREARPRSFPHAHFSDELLADLPSMTMNGWATGLTGVGPAYHGITGNEFFIRAERRLAAPVPVSFSDDDTAIASYTDGYSNDLLLAPTVYERIRKRDPNVLIWVAMHPIWKGADRLLLTDRAVMVDGFGHFLATQVQRVAGDDRSRALYAELDKEIVEAVVEELEDEDETVPDILTVYQVGSDAYTHVADKNPDQARKEYLEQVLDPLCSELHTALRARKALDDRYVVVTSDHGHTDVEDDDEHALATEDGDPPRLLEKAGFRVRPAQLEVADESDFQAVLAYQGAIAYVYVADRTACPDAGDVCDWKRPPRFEQDVLAAAEAFYRNNLDGSLVPEMKGTLDMVLTRKPRPFRESDSSFQVYEGGGRLESVEDHLKRHPRRQYVALHERLRHLAVGPAGERAGDILLIANNGNEKRAKERYYFAKPQESMHGSPSRRDSEVPLIVAHPARRRAELARTVDAVLGDEPYFAKVTDLLLTLRFGDRDGGSQDTREAAPARAAR